MAMKRDPALCTQCGKYVRRLGKHINQKHPPAPPKKARKVTIREPK